MIRFDSKIFSTPVHLIKTRQAWDSRSKYGALFYYYFYTFLN